MRIRKLGLSDWLSVLLIVAASVLLYGCSVGNPVAAEPEPIPAYVTWKEVRVLPTPTPTPAPKVVWER